MEPRPTVFLVDDDAGMRKSLRMLIQSAGLQTADYPSAETFLSDYDPDQPGCLVLDLRMPQMGGLELQSILEERHISLPVIILTGYGDVPSAVRCLKLGALDFLEKPVRPDTLLERVREAIDCDAQRREHREHEEEILHRMSRLSDRERQVMNLVTGGLSNKRIASRLGLSPKTVANHRANIIAKTGAANSADLARMVTLAAAFPDRTDR